LFNIIALALLFMLPGCARALPEPPDVAGPETASAEIGASLYEQTKAAFGRLSGRRKRMTPAACCGKRRICSIA